MTLGEEIQRLRNAAGLTQEALAVKLGIGQGGVNNIETGRSKPSVPRLYALAKALGVSCEHFAGYFPLEGAIEEPPPSKRK